MNYSILTWETNKLNWSSFFLYSLFLFFFFSFLIIFHFYLRIIKAQHPLFFLYQSLTFASLARLCTGRASSFCHGTTYQPRDCCCSWQLPLLIFHHLFLCYLLFFNNLQEFISCQPKHKHKHFPSQTLKKSSRFRQWKRSWEAAEQRWRQRWQRREAPDIPRSANAQLGEMGVGNPRAEEEIKDMAWHISYSRNGCSSSWCCCSSNQRSLCLPQFPWIGPRTSPAHQHGSQGYSSSSRQGGCRHFPRANRMWSRA